MKREWRVLHIWLGNHYGGVDSFNLGDKEKAKQYYQKGLAIAEDLVAQDPKNARFQHDLSICYAKAAEAFLESDPEKALDLYGKAGAINDNLMSASPKEFRYLSRKALYQRSIAVPLKNLGSRAAATKSLQASLQTLETMARMSPANAEAESGLHATLLALGHDALDAQDFESALPHFQRALAISQKQTANSRADLYAQWRLADSYFGLGRYYAMRKNCQEAKKWYGMNYEIWNGWSKHAVSTPFNVSRADAAVRELSRCNLQLANQ